MKARHLKNSLPWISPLQYLSPSSSSAVPTPSPPPPPPPQPTPPPRYITHPEAARLISIQSDPQRALDLFNSLSHQPGFSHNHATLSALLLRLAKSGKFAAVDSLLKLIHRHHSCRLYEPPFLSLISLLSSRFSLHEKSLEIFLSLPSLLRVKPSPKAVSACLNLLVESGKVELVDKLLCHVKDWYKAGLNTCICNILIKHYSKMGQIEKAFELLEKMRRSSLNRTKPDLITYSTLMGVLCKEGRIKDAFKLFDEMIERDKIMPDHLTYNILLDGFCKQGQMDKAKLLFGFMRNNGCEPNMFNYSTLMNGFCKEGNVEEVHKVFDEMLRSGMKIDRVSYTTLIGCLCRNGFVNKGIELVVEMNEKGSRADVITYNFIIEGLCKEERISEALELIEKLSYEGVKPNVASYRIVMNCFIARREMERAVRFLGFMLQKGFRPHYNASNQLLVGLCDLERINDATFALNGLTGTGFAPEIVTWNRLVESKFTYYIISLYFTTHSYRSNDKKEIDKCENKSDLTYRTFNGPPSLFF
ncbi:hypothetical protein LUZ60_001227 [Juncus effusus]|nr:hypothetical protein LUZ60_001227 [Juncus effusus]